MRKRSWFLLIAVVIATTVAAGAWFGRGVLQERLTSVYVNSQTSQATTIPPVPPAGVSIPFELVNNHIALEVSVNKSRPLSFLLDTGDKWAVIDIDRAKELGLGLGGSFSIKGVGSQPATGAFVQDAAFSIPAFAGFSQPVNLAMPLMAQAPRLGRDFDGIIGSEFIKHFVLEIDYQAGRIKLHDQDKFAYIGPGASIPMYLNSEGHPIIEAEITPTGSDPIKAEFAVDIGSGFGLALFGPFVAKLHLPGPDQKTVRKLGGAGLGGKSIGRVGRVSALKIGRFTLNNPITLFSADQAGAFAASDIQGNIGARVMNKFRIFLDYSRKQIILEPNVRFAEADSAASGLAIEAEGKGYATFRITDVLENSPASEAGLQNGDVIIAIDEQTSAKLTLSKVLDLFERPIAYKLTIKRGEQVLKITLTPRKLV